MASTLSDEDEDAWMDTYDLECTHCGGEGMCADGADPLGNCPDESHRCHACGGSGKTAQVAEHPDVISQGRTPRSAAVNVLDALKDLRADD